MSGFCKKWLAKATWRSDILLETEGKEKSKSLTAMLLQSYDCLIRAHQMEGMCKYNATGWQSVQGGAEQSVRSFPRRGQAKPPNTQYTTIPLGHNHVYNMYQPSSAWQPFFIQYCGEPDKPSCIWYTQTHLPSNPTQTLAGPHNFWNRVSSGWPGIRFSDIVAGDLERKPIAIIVLAKAWPEKSRHTYASNSLVSNWAGRHQGEVDAMKLDAEDAKRKHFEECEKGRGERVEDKWIRIRPRRHLKHRGNGCWKKRTNELEDKKSRKQKARICVVVGMKKKFGKIDRQWESQQCVEWRIEEEDNN